MPDQSPNERWTIYVHDDGQYLSVNDGIHGDTLLRMPDGWRDRARVRAFVEWVMPVLSSQEGGLTEYQIIEVRGLVADLLVDAPDKAERHLALIDAILAGRTDDADWLRSEAKGV